MLYLSLHVMQSLCSELPVHAVPQAHALAVQAVPRGADCLSL